MCRIIVIHYRNFILVKFKYNFHNHNNSNLTKRSDRLKVHKGIHI